MSDLSSRTLTDLDSEEICVDTSVPTDFSISMINEDHCHERSKQRKVVNTRKQSTVSKQLLERKQLSHDIQLLKLELSQKNVRIENIEADYAQKIEDLHERMADSAHQKQILEVKCESQMKRRTEESKQYAHFHTEFQKLQSRLHELEQSNVRLVQRATSVTKSLESPELTEEEYAHLKSQHGENLTLGQCVAVRFYEIARPLRCTVENCKTEVKVLNSDLKEKCTQLREVEEALQDEQRHHAEVQVKHQHVSQALMKTKLRIQQGDYKIEHYDRVKREKDTMESDYSDLNKKTAYLEASLKNLTEERDELAKENSALKQSLALLRQDKEYLSKRLSDSSKKHTDTEERLRLALGQLEDSKRAREELYDKYIHSRDKYKSEFEQKLQEGLEKIQLKTEYEIDRLQTSTREMYERENRSMREARDIALQEADILQCSKKDLQSKYDMLTSEFRELQTKGDNRTLELQNAIMLKSFENERTQITCEETANKLKDSQLQNEKLQTKFEVVSKEFFKLQHFSDRRISELETELSDKCSRLRTNETLEQELDDVVVQAAELDERDEENVLFPFGNYGNVPNTAKRRLKQRVHLARRVLQLERTISSLRKGLEKEVERSTKLTQELHNANATLDQARQPYNYLIDSIRQRESTVQQQKQRIISLQEELGDVERARTELARSKNQMTSDLERLLQQKEEMTAMKQLVLSQVRSSKSTNFANLENEDKSTPRPTVFTNTGPSNWLQTLKTKSASMRGPYDLSNR